MTERVYPHTTHQEEHGLAGKDLKTEIAAGFMRAFIIANGRKDPALAFELAESFLEERERRK